MHGDHQNFKPEGGSGQAPVSTASADKAGSFGSAFEHALPGVNLPKGGGAIRGIGEKFAANPATGTGTVAIPIITSPGRGGAGPSLALQYDSGAGNGVFGVGWSLVPAAISRKTDRGIPLYRDEEESDVFLLDGVEDLVPLRNSDGSLQSEVRDGFRIRRYRPRIDGSFALIERWTRMSDGDSHWRVTSASNVTSIYGKSMASRIADAADPRKVFSWLLCSTIDDKGNGTVYEYVPEDSRKIDLLQAHERNRDEPQRAVNRYLKRIKYGNRQSLLVQPDLAAAQWLFEVVFDYDEGHWLETVAPNDRGAGQVEASIDSASAWSVRLDAYSTHRPGFEVRTYRRCRRVLMFHRFAELGAQACLVASTDFSYKDLDTEASPSSRDELGHAGSTRMASQLQAVTHVRYRLRDAPPVARGGATFQSYEMQTLAPVEFRYTRALINEVVEEVDGDAIENLPGGFDGQNYQWLDLDGEGLPGVLAEQGGAWFYKANLSPIARTDEGVTASFAPLKQVAHLPQPGFLSGTRRWLDLDGNGALDLTQLAGPLPGFFERTAQESWQLHREFKKLPNIDWQNPNLRLVDLTGNGLPDVLVTEQDVLVWYAGEGVDGFAAAQRVWQSLDEETGPRALWADGTETIFLADMNGDGLIDLIRIRHADACYWPNLGYGRFGAKVALDNPPCFESKNQFDPRRIRLADITGSGTVDIVYLKRQTAQIYFNQSGNRLSDAYELAIPCMDDTANVAVVDLLGNGTACLVWNSPLAANSHAPMRYVRLLLEKPYLLTLVRNNAGGEIRVAYAPSTRFYLQDLYAGKPWLTKLPFPVHVVERVETWDAISRNRFTSRYAYHHGYFDGVEREFRGFAMVEQWDTDAYEDYVAGQAEIEGGQETAPQLYQPPVFTRTWFHTGADPDGQPLQEKLQREYFGAQGLLPDALLPDGLDADELRECVRALKGAILRREIYSHDGSDHQDIPYQVNENCYEVRCLQKRLTGAHAAFMRVDCESISAYYERNADDPRITHHFNLEVGPYGNVLRSASVVYGRQVADMSLPSLVRDEQALRSITYAQTDYTPDIDQAAPAAYRLRAPYRMRAYEITGIAPAAALFQRLELDAAIAGTTAIAYEVVADQITPQKRLLSWHCGRFLDNALNPLPLGQWDTLGLGAQSYALALTDALVASSYAGRVSHQELLDAGYVHLDGDTNWWISSPTPVYPANPGAHFYLPVGVRNPFGIETRVTFDQYDLLIEGTTLVQAPWNTSTVVNDYRLLGPVQATDANGNRAAVRLDVLGQVIATAVMGKAGSSDGDTLDDPSTRMEYDVFNFLRTGLPNVVHTFTREQHGAANTRWVESYTYTNGNGGVALVKAQAQPGRALQVDGDGNAVEVDADPRWIGNGRAILNNKGSVVKQYDPYFSVTHEYESERAVRELGVTPLFQYDPLGRNVRTDYPDGTHARVEFTPWLQRAFDRGDTVKDSAWYVSRGSPDPALEAEPVGNAPRRAAWLSAKHANTLGVAHLDSLGRPCYAVTDYGNGVTAASRMQRDLTGRYVTAFDQLGREVASGVVSMTGATLISTNMERGQRWSFFDITGAMIKNWDTHGRVHRTLLDYLRRSVGTAVMEPGQPERVWHCVVYGDRHPNARQLNLLGVPHMLFDQSGQVRVPSLDFKGHPSSAERLLARDYQNVVDWNAVLAETNYANLQALADPLLETGEVFTATGSYDALNRPTEVTLPDHTVMRPSYDVGGMLTSVRAKLQGQGAFVEFLRGQDYNAKGQRQFVRLGNDLITRYFYDPQSFRLVRLLTHADGGAPAAALQDLNFEFDAVGNIVQVRDDAQQTHYFNNAVVRPESLFEYDAVNQLIRASGRELAGGVNNEVRTHADLASIPQLPAANNDQAVRNYTEEYRYDLLGNITEQRHRFAFQAGVGAGWTRHYRYAYQDDPADRTNRLMASSLPGDADAGPYTGTYQYDAYGNMTRLPNLARLDWNAMDQLRRIDLGGGGTAHYVYDVGGQRVRKVIDRLGTLRLEWIFLGGVMIFRRRRRDTGQLLFERRTVHINDNAGAIAQADTKTVDINNDDPVNALDTPLIRYQHGNHLGSCGIETGVSGQVVSYEEYHPFGTSAYRANRAGYDLSLKRFRYSGKERDDESGLYYFGARYYAPWLGRWTSADPAGFVRGFNLYRYCSNNPVMFQDPNGMEEDPYVAPPSIAYGGTRQQFIDYMNTHELIGSFRGMIIGFRVNVTAATRVTGGDGREFWQATSYSLVEGSVRVIREASGEAGAEPGAGAGDAGDGGGEEAGSGDAASGGDGGTGDGDSGAGSGNGDTGDGADSTTGSGGGDTSADASSSDAATGSGAGSGTGDGSDTGSGSTDNPSPGANAATQAGPALERAIWARSFRDRGFILEHLYSNRYMDAIRAAGDNRRWFDVETATEVLQIKSSNSMGGLRAHASRATRDAGAAIHNAATPTMAGKSPRAVVITPTDIPAGASAEINAGYNNIRRPVPNSLPPENVRGIPGRAGTAARGLTGAGTALSLFSFGSDLYHGDYPMAGADALSTAGGALELYAMGAEGATVFGASAMSAGTALGGAGAAVGFGILAARSYERGDTAGVIMNGLGAVGGILLIASLFTPVGWVGLLGVGLVALAGGFNLGRWLAS